MRKKLAARGRRFRSLALVARLRYTARNELK